MPNSMFAPMFGGGSSQIDLLQDEYFDENNEGFTKFGAACPRQIMDAIDKEEGSNFFRSGSILQTWGSVQQTGNSNTVSVVFPVVYTQPPNVSLSVQAVSSVSVVNMQVPLIVGNPTASGFTFKVLNSNILDSLLWRAIGIK